MAKNNKVKVESRISTLSTLAIRERVKDQTITIEHIDTELMTDDPLTKDMQPSNLRIM